MLVPGAVVQRGNVTTGVGTIQVTADTLHPTPIPDPRLATHNTKDHAMEWNKYMEEQRQLQEKWQKEQEQNMQQYMRRLVEPET